MSTVATTNVDNLLQQGNKVVKRLRRISSPIFITSTKLLEERIVSGFIHLLFNLSVNRFYLLKVLGNK
jgi:hypothetical protein